MYTGLFFISLTIFVHILDSLSLNVYYLWFKYNILLVIVVFIWSS